MASLMAEKTTFKWNELSNDSKWILDGTSHTGSFTKNGENYIWADTVGNRWENMEYDGEKFTSPVPGQVFNPQADGGMTCGTYHWSLQPKVHVPKSPKVSIDVAAKFCGQYECHKYDGGGKNDWHYVTLTTAACDGDSLTWTNRAGVSWSLHATEGNDLTVGENCPYYKDGHTSAKVDCNEQNRVVRIRGPGDEWYDRVVPDDKKEKKSLTIFYGDTLKLINQYQPENGYLDTCCMSPQGGGGYDIHTHPNPNRDGGSGTWRVVKSLPDCMPVIPSVDGVPVPVQYGDMVKFINHYNPKNGYLDTCGYSPNTGSGSGGLDGCYAVHTHPNPNRDGGSGTWQVVKSLPDGMTVIPTVDGVPAPVQLDDMVKLINQYSSKNGYLDTCCNSPNTGGGSGGGYQVHTHPNPNRDGGSGTWQVVKNF